jgi:coatomer protein complex subunit epsilon
MDVDELWSMRNQFAVGNFDAALNEAEMARIDDQKSKTERDFYVARALLAKGEVSRVLKEVPETHPALELRALRQLALVLSPAVASAPEQRQKSLATLKAWSEQDATANAGLALMTGIAFSAAGDANEALRALRARGQPSLEAMHLSTVIYTSMDRADAAKRVLEQMQAKDEDSTITQLSAAWVALALGGEEKNREAVYILQELIGKWQATPLLVGALSVALLQQGKFADAEKALAHCQQANPSEASLLVNRIACAQHENKSTAELMALLKALSPNHSFFAGLAAQSSAFDQAAKAYALKP